MRYAIVSLLAVVACAAYSIAPVPWDGVIVGTCVALAYAAGRFVPCV